jgi:hypothetical protein
LLLDVPVSLSSVERVRTLADHVRADAQRAAAGAAGPLLGRSQQPRSDAVPALRLVDDETRDLRG